MCGGALWRVCACLQRLTLQVWGVRVGGWVGSCIGVILKGAELGRREQVESVKGLDPRPVCRQRWSQDL